MNFSTAVRAALKQYATFGGRARRSEYWFFTLLAAIFSVAEQILAQLLQFGAVAPSTPVTVLLWSLIIVVLALFIPSLAVSVRRLHDVDRSGWFLLLCLIPVVGSIILLVWFGTQGTRGENRFGDDPIPASEYATVEAAPYKLER